MVDFLVILFSLGCIFSVDFIINPLTAGAAYIWVFIFISTLSSVPPFKHVKDKI